MHARGGFQQTGFLDDAWAVLVDLTCLGILIWILTGLYMWWKAVSIRRSGWIALISGFIFFAVFLAGL
jgi:hypothetical protein